MYNSLQNYIEQHHEALKESNLIYKDAAISQMAFFRDYIGRLFCRPEEYKGGREFVRVCSGHMSKSVQLPVYYFETPVVTVVARNNFYNWNTTILSKRPLDIPDYFHINDSDGYLFFEGFPDHLQMKPYNPKPGIDYESNFSFCTWGNDYLYYAIMLNIAVHTKE